MSQHPGGPYTTPKEQHKQETTYLQVASSGYRVVSVNEYVSTYHSWVYKTQGTMDTATSLSVGLNFDR